MSNRVARATWAAAWCGALLGLVLAWGIWAPARWLAWGLAQASQGQVQWHDARGTLWSGSARVVLTGGAQSRDAQALPGRLQWQITPRWDGLHIAWHANCCMTEAASLQIQAGWARWHAQLSDHTAIWPAALLSGLGAPWNTLQPEGQLQLRTQALQLHWAQGRIQMQGQAELRLQNLSSRLSTLQPIGTYLLHVRGTPEGTPTPSLQLSSEKGPLLLTGQGQWVGARWRFTGEASAEEGSESALNNLLNIIGRRQGGKSLLSLG